MSSFSMYRDADPSQSDRYCPICRYNKLTGRQQTCSDKCRKRRQRQRQDISYASGQMIAHLNVISLIIKQRPDLAAMANEQLREVEAHIRDTLRLRPDEDTKSKLAMLYDRSRTKFNSQN